MVILSQTQNFALAAKVGIDIDAMTLHVRIGLMYRVFATSADQIEAVVRSAVVDFGGTLIEPARSNPDTNRISSWGPFDFQLDLLECSGTGDTFAELAADWAKAAWRMTPRDAVAAE